jgi:hypothetical protein
MKHPGLSIALLFLAALLAACDSTQQSEKHEPRLTAQGFVINDTQEGIVKQFDAIRLRIESRARIKTLHIQERSYDVDLATSPEREHYKLFGLTKKARLHQDITLDFSPYINQKLTKPGDYTFGIEVKDKNNKTATAVLKIKVNPDPAITSPIQTGEFKLLREGKGDVKQGIPFGVTWKTIDATRVTIQISKVEGGATRLARFSREDFEKLQDKSQLAKWIRNADNLDVIEFPTAFDDAFHEVFGIENQGQPYLLCVCKSKTDLSDIGTTVYLTGEYKY